MERRLVLVNFLTIFTIKLSIFIIKLSSNWGKLFTRKNTGKIKMTNNIKHVGIWKVTRFITEPNAILVKNTQHKNSFALEGSY